MAGEASGQHRGVVGAAMDGGDGWAGPALEALKSKWPVGGAGGKGQLKAWGL